MVDGSFATNLHERSMAFFVSERFDSSPAAFIKVQTNLLNEGIATAGLTTRIMILVFIQPGLSDTQADVS